MQKYLNKIIIIRKIKFLVMVKSTGQIHNQIQL